MFEYSKFRSNVIDNLDEKIFDKPLCEVMHNQKYFNGIGNYLRAEIIFRFVAKSSRYFNNSKTFLTGHKYKTFCTCNSKFHAYAMITTGKKGRFK